MAALVNNYFQKTKMNVMEASAKKSPDVNPNKKLCGDLIKKFNVLRPLNNEELKRFTKEERTGIPQEIISKAQKLQQTTAVNYPAK